MQVAFSITIENIELGPAVDEHKVYGPKEVHATRIPTKTEYSFKGM